jgi:beta-glucosidase-like glycosyl hydrolase
MTPRRIEEESIVLLKNNGELLPLKAQHLRRVAVIGAHADVGVRRTIPQKIRCEEGNGEPAL